jgi:hypothetical protein
MVDSSEGFWEACGEMPWVGRRPGFANGPRGGAVANEELGEESFEDFEDFEELDTDCPET